MILELGFAEWVIYTLNKKDKGYVSKDPEVIKEKLLKKEEDSARRKNYIEGVYEIEHHEFSISNFKGYGFISDKNKPILTIREPVWRGFEYCGTLFDIALIKRAYYIEEISNGKLESNTFIKIQAEIVNKSTGDIFISSDLYHMAIHARKSYGVSYPHYMLFDSKIEMVEFLQKTLPYRWKNKYTMGYGEYPLRYNSRYEWACDMHIFDKEYFVRVYENFKKQQTQKKIEESRNNFK